MALRMILLVAAALASMPVLAGIYRLVSATSTFEVAIGFSLLLMFAVTWIEIGSYYVRYFRQKAVESEMVKQFKDWGLVILCLATLANVGCGRTIVEPGHVGIKVDYYGTDRGVESYPQVTGIVWYNPFTTSVFQYPTFVQTAVWSHSMTEGNPVNEEINFTTADQMQVAADISLAYHLQPDKVPAFYVKFRSQDLGTFTHGFLRNQAREKFDNAAGKYRIEQIMGDNAPFLKETREALQAELTTIGVQIDQFGFIGAPRPPQQVIEAINAKVKATQIAIQVENEVRQTKAQAEKNVAEAEGQARALVARAEGNAKAAIAQAQGDAEANRLLSQSITANLIEWRRIGVQQQGISKWSGVLPSFIGGATPIPFINVDKEK